jgi:uncharacterized damage-inducible protein DinB
MILETNLELLEEAADVLADVDDATYVRPAALFDGQQIGKHVRHIIEFYEALFRGLQEGCINYDARHRDPVLESNREVAICRLRYLAGVLRQSSGVRANRVVWVAGEGSGYAESSVARELQALCSHTVHHFALIAVLLRYYGLPVPSDFGFSKATVQYRASQRAKAREAA